MRAPTRVALAAALAAWTGLTCASAPWPTFRGPSFDGHAPGGARLFEGETATLAVGWRVALGPGYSAPIVGDGLVFAMFAQGDADFLAAFDPAEGAERWRYRISRTYAGHDGSHDGPISTPALEGGRVFGLGAWGDLFAVEAATGRPLWTTHLADALGADKPHYGFASSPRVVDGVLLVELSQISENHDPASTKPPKPMAIAGLDPATGSVLWIAGDDHVEYHTATPATLGGQRQVLAVGQTWLLGLEPRTGKQLWSYKHEGDDRAMGGMTIVPLVAGDDRVFLMNKQDSSVMLRVVRRGAEWEVSPLWSNDGIARSYVPPVYHGGYLYGMNNRIFTCLNAETGETAWRSREPGDGFPIVVGKHLVVMTKPGSLHVIDASPAGYRERARLDLFGEHSWSEPVFAEGHLFARSMAHLARVDVQAGTPAERGRPAWFAGTLLGRFLAELEGAADKAAAIDAFLAAHPEAPIVESDGTVHFIYRGAAADVGIVGDMIGSRREDPMTRVAGTDFFHYTTRLEPTAAVTYGFIVDYKRAAPDPRNPRPANGLFGDVSWFGMPAWEGADFLGGADPDGQGQGRLETIEWTPPGTEPKPRQAEVYLPAGYDGGTRRYPVAYVHGGRAALDQGRMKQALDRLIGARIAPLIAVFVPPADPQAPRADERDEHYVQAIAEGLVPRIDASFRTIAAAPARASIGSGGMAGQALLVAFERPELFGRAGAQSPFFDDENIPGLAERGADVRPLVLYLDWGTYHMRSPHEAWSLVEANRKLWHALRAAGYRPAGGERPEGFGWPIFSAHTDELFAALFPPERPAAAARTPGADPQVNARFVAPDADLAELHKTFETESREIFARRESIVASLGLAPGEVVADVGAGTGLFLAPLAAAVGSTGQVVAVEISAPLVESMRKRAEAEGLAQVKVVLGSERSTNLAAASIDLAFVCDTYHHFTDPASMLANLRAALRPGGRLVVVDFERVPGVSRPWVLDHVRTGKREVIAEIEAAGFTRIDEPAVTGLKENYVLRFRRP